MTNPAKFPTIPRDVIEELEKRFPATIPADPKVSLDDLRFQQGQVRVVSFLRHQFNLQNQTVLENE